MINLRENKRYLFLGFFFIFIQIVAILRNILSDYYNFFWFCDFISIFIAIFFFLKKEDLIKAVVNIGLLAQLIFLVGIISSTFFGFSFLDSLPQNYSLFYFLSSVLIHLSVTFALILTYKIKPTIKTLFYSIIMLFCMYFVALFFTNPEQGINYVFSSKSLFSLIIPHYTQLWVPLTFIMVVLPTQLIQYLIYRKFMKGSKSKKK
ncbi:hypothetical protein GW931_02390 [archaeon]|nr:hypothetical protein [archaeon]PJC45640.1 MAG: hypothetical protein CO037_00440 [Candidatus Pacearchaeota archaeon CG_4_9_14_0_2_um_filter_30_8]